MSQTLLRSTLAATVAALGLVGCGEEVQLEDGSTPGMDGGNGLDGGDGGNGLDGGDGGSLTCRGFGETLCGAECVNTQGNPANCGGCGVACAAAEVCVSNACADSCPTSLTACAGTCVDLNTDNAHCGACGTACPAGEGCTAGSCEPSIELGPPPARCVGGGPSIEIGPVCTGRTAGATFTHGLCTCRDLGPPGREVSTLRVDAYDSTMGPYVPGGLGGDVGVNGDARTSRVEVWGDITTTGAAGFRVRDLTDVYEDVATRNGLQLEARLDVRGAARVSGPIAGDGSLAVGGTLETDLACGSWTASVTAGMCISGPVTVEEPCPCDVTELIPVQEIVTYFADPSRNDNATVGLDPAALAAPGGRRRLDLPCGYYHLSQIHGGDGTTIAVHGRTAIFITGSIQVGAELSFALDPGATLDVFVAGTFNSSGDLWIGNPAYAAQSRFYVGGVCDDAGGSCSLDADCCSQDCGPGGTCVGTGPEFSVRLSSDTVMSGLLYGPYGPFITSDPLEMFGAIFAGDYHSSDTTRVHYDLRSLRLGDDCPDPDPVPDGGVPADGGVPSPCGPGVQQCGPGLPACPAGDTCFTGCCVTFG